MTVRVLVVDDSSFFRNRIQEALSSDPRIQIVGTAVDGREAVAKAKELKPDLITMDVEMPQLNGIEAVRQIMRQSPTNVLMLSSLTHEGARVTLEALEAGAADYLAKDIRAWMDRSSVLRQELIERVVALGKSRRYRGAPAFSREPSAATSTTSTSMVFRPEPATSPGRPTAASAARPAVREPVAQERVVRPADDRSGAATQPLSRVRVPDARLVVIGASTGGPAALQKVLVALPANFPCPILLVQHMPGTFTKVFAERLNQQARIRVREAVDGDRLEPGLALLCPGGMQMMLDPRQTDRVKILPGDDRMTYKPSVDVTYASAAKAYGAKVLAIMLTGMGSDGCDGARLLKQAGGTLWAQSKETCTIYGMPQAVVNAGLTDAVLDLDDIGSLLAKCRNA
ncbi:MAG: chemotaxis response regulator protein-glutamate methylesterase [Nitrincola lacisaponensis]|uniref:Protein-glutamate methylesterase/protein-glutamine glutaminase n=1 Tax=Nitrincola lacisaponensis TaxID=267850 RepID=A0A063Y1N6_9GAMM|nr:chemotaxis response regulator protein-glutamate methylesterase [Nitrincola lacisaponensis]KDE39584.1 Chemotaxis response regulator protein-glutamate methylesterase CheB [Nitrincola lacisaponensis]